LEKLPPALFQKSEYVNTGLPAETYTAYVPRLSEIMELSTRGEEVETQYIALPYHVTSLSVIVTFSRVGSDSHRQ